MGLTWHWLVLRPTYPILTERLALPPFREPDLDAFHDLQRRPDELDFAMPDREWMALQGR